MMKKMRKWGCALLAGVTMLAFAPGAASSQVLLVLLFGDKLSS